MVNFIENITWILCITDVKCFSKIKLKQQQIGACCCSHSCVFSYIYSLWLWCCRPLTQREMALLSTFICWSSWVNVVPLCLSVTHRFWNWYLMMGKSCLRPPRVFCCLKICMNCIVYALLVISSSFPQQS